MLDKMKAMGAMAALLKDKDKLRDAGERVKQRAEQTFADGEAGGGAVRATSNGRMELISIELSPAILPSLQDETSRDMAQGLIVEAVNASIKAAQARMQEIVQEEAGELGLGDIAGDLGKLIS